MTGSFFRLCMYTGKPVEWNGLVVFGVIGQNVLIETAFSP